MYTPAHFEETDLEQLDALAKRDAFCTLVSVIEGVPFATHLPVAYRRQANAISIKGHWAKPNPQWQTIEQQQALLIFHGPHAYVSPRWYKEPALNVPTWNYATAHLYGQIRTIQDPIELGSLLKEFSEEFEGTGPDAWRFNPSQEQRRLRGIVGFAFTADRVEIKLKMSQNHSLENVDGVVRGLLGRDENEATEVATLMKNVRLRRATR